MQLCEIAGRRVIAGGNGLATGVVDRDPANVEGIVEGLVAKGFEHDVELEATALGSGEAEVDMGRETYAGMFGPTVGDRVRLGDTALWVEVEEPPVRLAPFVAKLSLT